MVLDDDRVGLAGAVGAGRVGEGAAHDHAQLFVLGHLVAAEQRGELGIFGEPVVGLGHDERAVRHAERDALVPPDG